MKYGRHALAWSDARVAGRRLDVLYIRNTLRTVLGTEYLSITYLYNYLLIAFCRSVFEGLYVIFYYSNYGVADA